MPNWCFTQYVAEGPKEQLRRLHETMVTIAAMPFPGLIENDFGSAWLGNLVMTLGVDPREESYFRCRGEYNVYDFDDKSSDTLLFDTTTAWCEADDTRRLIEKIFPGVHLYFISEEFGCGYWETNDVQGKYFRDRYFLRTEDDDATDEHYFETLEELADAVMGLTGLSGLSSFEECEQALENYRDSDYAYSLLRVKFEEPR